MKRLLITSILSIFALAVPAMAQAPAAPAKKSAEKQPAKAADAPAADAKPADKAKPEAPKKAPKAQGTAGKVTAVDAEKKTITVGKTVYAITDETQYVNKEAPAALTDVVAGMNVGLSYTADKEGKRTLVKVNVGVKQDPAPKAKTEKTEPAKKAATEKKK
ncbi:MAG TPA: hypothetical protein VHM91_24440 [Verrucomicrobiales bacterium]|jgi:hypothetical protein|nr:hypothetical protein [Verrucomicrobiales bacterium]